MARHRDTLDKWIARHVIALVFGLGMACAFLN